MANENIQERQFPSDIIIRHTSARNRELSSTYGRKERRGERSPIIRALCLRDPAGLAMEALGRVARHCQQRMSRREQELAVFFVMSVYSRAVRFYRHNSHQMI